MVVEPLMSDGGEGQVGGGEGEEEDTEAAAAAAVKAAAAAARASAAVAKNATEAAAAGEYTRDPHPYLDLSQGCLRDWLCFCSGESERGCGKRRCGDRRALEPSVRCRLIFGLMFWLGCCF